MVGRKVGEMDSLMKKVLEGLECHKDEIPGVCRDCPYFTESGFCSGRLAKDALAMLKENEKDIEALKKSYNELAEKGEPVVRCKDCKNKECWGRAGDVVCGIDGTPHRPNWFCADGERKEGEYEC